MSSSFNLNTFLNEQNSYMNMKFTAAENGKAAMEERDIERAKEAVETTNKFLGLTLGEKMKELGIGERVMQQVVDTATGLVTDIIDPLTDYLNKYEKVFDQEMYKTEIQSYAKQMFFSGQALKEEAASSVVGQRFVYDM